MKGLGGEAVEETFHFDEALVTTGADDGGGDDRGHHGPGLRDQLPPVHGGAGHLGGVQRRAQRAVPDIPQQQLHQPIFVNLLYMEDFDPDVDPEFIKQELRPYFSGVFADLALRST